LYSAPTRNKLPIDHCRWCLRGQYPIFSLSEEELERIARFCGDEGINEEVSEVLVTGGDPLMVPDSLNFFLDALGAHAPNITVARVGSRLPLQDPDTNRILLQSGYSYEERTRWNPSWQLPDSGEIDENSKLRVWYLDGAP